MELILIQVLLRLTRFIIASQKKDERYSRVPEV